MDGLCLIIRDFLINPLVMELYKREGGNICLVVMNKAVLDSTLEGRAAYLIDCDDNLGREIVLSEIWDTIRVTTWPDDFIVTRYDSAYFEKFFIEEQLVWT